MTSSSPLVIQPGGPGPAGRKGHDRHPEERRDGDGYEDEEGMELSGDDDLDAVDERDRVFGDDIGQGVVPLSGLELGYVGFARIVDNAVHEARMMQELHLDDERRARSLFAPQIEDR